MTTMTYEQEKESLARVLRDKIFSYKAARPNLSSSQIASKFGMSSSTFSRLENLDIKTPTFDQVIRIFKGTGDKEGLLKYLKEYYPELINVYLDFAKDGVSVISEQNVKFLTDERTSKLMLLAYSKCGLSLELVKEEFGKEGLRNLELLVSKGALKERNGSFYPDDEAVMLSQSDTKFLCEYSIKDLYNLTGFESGEAGNYLTFQSESIDLDRVYPQIVSLLQETNQRVREIFNNPENHGKDTVFVTLVSDSIIPNDLRKRNLEIKGTIQ